MIVSDLRTSPKPRRAVRGLLVTPDQHILLIKIHSPVRDLEMWMTPGGGVEEGESDLEALRRELYEETGLETFTPGPMVWTREFSFPWQGGIFHQYEEYYFISTPCFEPSMHQNPAVGEKEIFKYFRWWPLDELLLSSEIFAPGKLAQNLQRLLSGLAGEGAKKPDWPVSLTSQNTTVKPTGE